jgi:NADH-quinone oxidoreductase subunit J
MEISPIFFYLFAGIAIGFSLLVILKKNPVASAFSLVLVFFAFAGIYALLSAHLIAALQVLVYAGAIMVLFVFVIMLLNADGPSFDLPQSQGFTKTLAGILCLGLIAMFTWIFKHSVPAASAGGRFTLAAIEEWGGNTQVVSELLFSEYILPFELTSVLLLVGVVGAVSLAKRKPGGFK